MKDLFLFSCLSLILAGCNMNPNKEARIQELESKVENLAAKVDDMEGQIQSLEEANKQLTLAIEKIEEENSATVN